MSKEKRSLISDEGMLVALLATIIKKAGGELKIPEAEMDNVNSSDMVMMYYDEDKKEIILTNHLLFSGLEDEIF